MFEIIDVVQPYIVIHFVREVHVQMHMHPNQYIVEQGLNLIEFHPLELIQGRIEPRDHLNRQFGLFQLLMVLLQGLTQELRLQSVLFSDLNQN